MKQQWEDVKTFLFGASCLFAIVFSIWKGSKVNNEKIN